MWEFLGRGFTIGERKQDPELAPYMTMDALDEAFYDLEKYPLRTDPAPTATQAQAASLLYPTGDVTVNGITAV